MSWLLVAVVHRATLRRAGTLDFAACTECGDQRPARTDDPEVTP